MGMLTGTRRALLGGNKNRIFGFILPDALNPLASVFNSSAAIRAGALFAGAPMIQGAFDGSGTPDVVRFSQGSQISGNWYGNFDPNQGFFACIWTSEKDRDATQSNYDYIYWISSNDWARYEHDNQRFYIASGGQIITVSYTMVAGTPVALFFRWDCNTKHNGTNYACLSINDVATWGITTQPTAVSPSSGINYLSMGSKYTATFPANARIENFTIGRFFPYDGTYGIDIFGDGTDVVAAQYNGGAFADISEVLKGAWDTVYSLPTNATPGALVSGEGNAWSFPHASNLLGIKTGFMLDGFGPDQAFAVGYNATTTSAVVADGAAIQDLQDAAFTAEAWVRIDGAGEAGFGTIFSKRISGIGWWINTASPYGITAKIDCATTDANSNLPSGSLNPDGKWHHVAMYFNDAGDRKIYIAVDGVWSASYHTQTAGVGAIVTDVGNNLYVGSYDGGAYTFDGLIGWCRISNNDRYTAGGAAFTPPRTMPADDGNTVLLINMNEGTGTTLDNAASTGAAYDATLSNGTWTRKFAFEGTPDSVAELAVAERMFGLQGWKVTTSGANIGVYYDIPVTAGDNFAQRALAYSDGNSVPKMVFWDVDNAAEIGSITSDVANRAANGTFASDTLWNKGTGWTIPGGNVAHHTGAAGVLTQQVSQEINGGVIKGVSYRVTYTVTNYVSGSVNIQVGGIQVTSPKSADGTYTQILTPNDDTPKLIYILASADFVGDISAVTVTRTATKAHPDNMLFTAQAPAGCSTIRVKLINTVATTSAIAWHQAEVYTNLIDSPSFATWQGTSPDLPIGYTTATLDVGDVEPSSGGVGIIHSGNDSAQLNAGATSNEFMIHALTLAGLGEFYSYGSFIYGSGAAGASVYAYNGRLVKQSTLATNVSLTSIAASWQHIGRVGRSAGHVNVTAPYIAGCGAQSYVDDVYMLALNPVSLTVTPASQANSLEGTGIRVDGRDTLTQPRTAGLKANKGTIRFSATARHNPANWVKFGKTQGYLLDMYEDANNYLRVYISAANTMTIAYNAKGAGAVTATYDATGVSFAGVLKQYIVSYGSGGAILNIGGAVVATAAGAVAFATAPTLPLNFGVRQDGTLPFDGVIGPY